jgi:hypothetical protein
MKNAVASRSDEPLTAGDRDYLDGRDVRAEPVVVAERAK